MGQITLSQMLEAREKRAQRQQELLSAFHLPLVSFTLNIPGPVKYSPSIRRAYEMGRDMLCMRLRPVHVQETIADTGCEALMAVRGNPQDIKRETVSMEEADALGRLFDMDVLDENGRHIGRQEIGMPERLCMLCSQKAHACARNRTHSLEQLREHVHHVIEEALAKDRANRLASLAQRALLYEVSVTPKPGLVDRHDSGAHKDMDYFTFMDSISSLYPYFLQCASMGAAWRGTPQELFAALREPGKRAEETMHRATDGVNTHKGAIFIMGLACAAAARLGEGVSKGELLDYCARMVKEDAENYFAALTPDSARTAGDRLYLAHGLRGVRGQAARGFPVVGDVGLPALEKALEGGMSLNDAACCALLEMIPRTEDTVLINRCGYDRWLQLKEDILQRLSDEGASVALARELNRKFCQSALSPGGCADLLSLALFLHFL